MKVRAYAIWIERDKAFRAAVLELSARDGAVQRTLHQHDVVMAAIRAVVNALRRDEPPLPQRGALFRRVVGVKCR